MFASATVGSTATVVRNSVSIISHITFQDCRVHTFSDNLSRNSCIQRADSTKVALGIGNWALARKLLLGGPSGKYLHCSVCPNDKMPNCQYPMPKATFAQSAISVTPDYSNIYL